MKVSGRLLLSAGLFGAVSLVGGQAQGQERDWCEQSWDDDWETVCEVREFTFASDGDLVVDGGTNGGIDVEGWDRDDVLVQARVRTRARDEARAADMADAIEVTADARRVEADGPNTRRREGWSVSYRVFVPRDTDLNLETHNGGISIADVRGDIEFAALNGGVSVTRLAGDVSGHTTNGGLRVDLEGSRWDGAGLDVETTNGGVVVSVPSGYNADFETGTVNGSVELDFPVTVRGRVSRQIKTTLGSGGPLVRITTTNGGVRLLEKP